MTQSVEDLMREQLLRAKRDRALVDAAARGAWSGVKLGCFLLLMIFFVIMALSAKAQTICDFEHKCYPEGGIDGGRQLAPRAPDRTGRPPTLPSQLALPAPQDPICHLMRIREAPSAPFHVVEMCSIPAAEEVELHRRAAVSPQPPWALR